MLATANLWGVVETSEARYAEIGREMLRSGDWIHPQLLKISHYHKPPVTYWLTAASLAVFGVNAFAVRFFLVVAFCIQAVLVHRIAWHLFRNERFAYYAALVYATLPVVLISVRGLTTDAYLTTFVLLAVYSWIRFLESARVRFLYGMAFACAIGFLTKGPVVLMMPVFAMIGLRSWRPAPAIGGAKVFLAVAIFLISSFSWFIALTMEDVRYADYFFFRHIVDRVAHAEVFSRAEPWYYYFPLLPAIYTPWIAVIFGRRVSFALNSDTARLIRDIALWWFLAPLVLFSLFNSKLVLYILPLSVSIALLAAWSLSFRASRLTERILFALIALIYVALIVVPSLLPAYRLDAAAIAIPASALAISIGTFFYRLKKETLITAWSVLFAATLIVYSALFFRINSVEVNAMAPVAHFIEEKGLKDRNVLVINELLPSLAFELDKEVISVYAGNRSLKRETQFQADDRWKSFLLDATNTAGRMKLRPALGEPVVLVARKQLPDSITGLMRGHWREKKFGKWIVYYN
jgi:4-amino-4-deoxy-L-arabinose transferase